MSAELSNLEPHIEAILVAPGTNLETISAKRVRQQLVEADSSITAEFLKENRDDVDAIIAKVYKRVSDERGLNDDAEEGSSESQSSRKRKQDEDTETSQGDEEEIDDDDAPRPKKLKSKQEIGDEELARKLSSEINNHSTRGVVKGRGANSTPRKRGMKKSAATVISDEDGDGKESRSKSKGKSGGGARGGFAKEYALSEPLAALLKVNRLSRPQVVKQLWDYIKANGLQNPSNRKEIICDDNMKAIFGVDKIGMFKMNQSLSQHLHKNEG